MTKHTCFVCNRKFDSRKAHVSVGVGENKRWFDFDCAMKNKPAVFKAREELVAEAKQAQQPKEVAA